jgi:hypothetical protein
VVFPEDLGFKIASSMLSASVGPKESVIESLLTRAGTIGCGSCSRRLIFSNRGDLFHGSICLRF